MILGSMCAIFRILICAVPLLIPLAFAHGAQKEQSCIDWHRLMANYELEELRGNKVILIHPFTDFTKISGDEWLQTGLRDYLADLLHSSHGLRVLAGPTAMFALQSGGMDYRIEGMYQREKERLRVFVKLTNGRTGELIRQYELRIPYPDNMDFFALIADAAKEIMKETKTSFDSKAFDAVRDATASTRAYECYSRGHDDLRAYSTNGANKAKHWFEETKRIDYRSPLGYEGMIELYIFLGFYHKQRQEQFSHYFQQAEDEMLKMQRLARPAPMLMTRKKNKVVKKEKDKPLEVTSRILISNVAFADGIQLSSAGRLAEAASAFRKSAELVPQDAISWYYLSRAEAGLGKLKESEEALRKAYAINPCIEARYP